MSIRITLHIQPTLQPTTLRLLESAAEELARLDELAAVAPRSIALALHADLTARLAMVMPQAHAESSAVAHAVPRPVSRTISGADSLRPPDIQATPPGSDSLVADGISVLIAASVDAVHVEACPPHLMQLHELVIAEERRARTGAPLTLARVLAHEASVPSLPGAPPMDLAALDEALRPGGQPRPVLMRAVAAAAACGEGVLAELVPALLLCSAGLTDQLRLLPFAGVDAAGREDSLSAWRAGDEEPFATLVLGECAQGARDRRMAIRRALVAMGEDESHLAPLGRAAITARRALAVLRDQLATSMPQLSAQLECSRPAAGDALERLVEVGLAVEITGRHRDRVFACARAMTLL